MTSFVQNVFLFVCALCYTAQAATLSKSFKFSTSVVTHIVDIHNNLRQNISQGTFNGQPSASNMMQLVSDAQLASVAKSWAEKCNFAHSDGTKVPNWSWVGQNLYVGTLGAAINTANDNELKTRLKAGLDSWASEVQWFTHPKTCSAPAGKSCGHYTQLAWAKTAKVGCGVAQCNGIGGIPSWDGKLVFFMVCNYGPGGNYNGEDTYAKGTSCSACPANTKCQPNKLCASP